MAAEQGNELTYSIIIDGLSEVQPDDGSNPHYVFHVKVRTRTQIISCFCTWSLSSFGHVQVVPDAPHRHKVAEWIVTKRYSEFAELDRNLRRTDGEVFKQVNHMETRSDFRLNLPGKTFLPPSQAVAEERLPKLERYLRLLLDVDGGQAMILGHLREFLEIEKHRRKGGTVGWGTKRSTHFDGGSQENMLLTSSSSNPTILDGFKHDRVRAAERTADLHARERAESNPEPLPKLLPNARPEGFFEAASSDTTSPLGPTDGAAEEPPPAAVNDAITEPG